MRRLLLYIVICGISASALYTQQTSWQWVNPLPQGNILNSIWSINQDTVFCVGDYGTIMKSTNGGQTWRVTQNAASVTEPLYATQFTTSTIGWAIGEGGRILKTTDAGTTWLIHNSPTTKDLFGIHFISTSTGFIIGAQGTIYKTTNGGTDWTYSTPITNATLYNVYFYSPNLGWIVGTNGKVLATTNGGTTWELKTTGTNQNLYTVQFISPTVGYAVGSFGLLIKSTDGGNSWQSQASGTDFSLYSMHFITPSRGWAVGSWGATVATTDGGNTWVEQSSGTYNDIYSVRFASPSVGWAIGDFGTIIKTTNGGTNWFSISTGVKNILYGIHFSSGTNGLAVGEEGTIIRTMNGGNTWTQYPSGVSPTLFLYGVFMLDNNIAWVVGDSAVVMKTTNGGYSWSRQNSRTEELSLYSIYFVNASTGWAVGDFGTILATNNGGLTWVAQTSNTYNPLMKVKFFNTSIGWTVGYGGEILKTTNGGQTWIPQISNTYQTLYSLDIIDQNTVYATGDFGAIVSTTDGGTNWTPQMVSSISSFYGTTFLSRNVGWAAGDDGEILNTTDGGINWNFQRSGTLNTLWEIQLIKSGTGGGSLFATGIGGTILTSSASPSPTRIWTGQFDTLWSSPANWHPSGVPENGDSVIIPFTVNKPAYRTLNQQVNIGALYIAPNTKLTFGSGLAQLVVSGNIRIEGTLLLEPASTLELIVGGNFLISASGKFIPGQSTVNIMNKGQLRGSFFNLLIGDSAKIQSIDNIEIKNNLRTFSNISLRSVDTLSILNPDGHGIQGNGIILAGTVKRTIRPGATIQYRFESPVTYLQFYPTGTLPDTILMTVYPNSLAPLLPESAFVKRYYSITPIGGSNYRAFMSLRYDTSESTIPIYDLGLFRDSNGVIVNMGVTDYLDSDVVAINLDSVSKFSNWFLGRSDYTWRHPFHFIDSLIIRDNGSITDTLYYGTIPGATDGIDLRLGEITLSPKPPAGTYDVRWLIPPTNGTQVDIRDIISFTHTEVIFTGSLQPGPGGYPFTLRWNNANLPLGTFTLRDAATQSAQFSINMKMQNSYVITNPAITSFQIAYTVSAFYTFNAGWNMMSIPVDLIGDNKKTTLFPNAISFAFGYNQNYYIANTLTHGRGYWLKFPAVNNIPLDGIPLTVSTNNVQEGWNMIGSISSSISTASIIQVPGNIVRSDYFGYSGSYAPIDTLRPAKGYWVKVNQPGQLVLSDGGFAVKASSFERDEYLKQLNTISLIDNEGNTQSLHFGKSPRSSFSIDRFELPPLPPEGLFDARFSTNRMVELLQDKSEPLTIMIQSSSYPIKVSWEITQNTEQTVVMTNSSNGKQLSPKTNNSIIITDPSIKRITLTLSEIKNIPTEFSLKQNYPNPFNPITKIDFDLPIDAFVSLQIYNVLGQEVSSIINHKLYDAGTYSVEVNANMLGTKSNIGSGLYFYRMHAQSENKNFVQVKKMLIIK
ncbi:MAG: YCF48-related protein [Bacteroidota bacterium]|nr:YCF48-related protein [Bacteroidota bacterium]